MGVFAVNGAIITGVDVVKDSLYKGRLFAPFGYETIFEKLLNPYSKFTDYEKYKIIVYLGSSGKYGTDMGVFKNLKYEQYKEVIKELRKYRKYELNYLKDSVKENYDIVDGYNETIKNKIGFTNRGSLTNLRLWLFLLSPQLNDYTLTEYSQQEAVYVIPDELFNRAERLFK